MATEENIGTEGLQVEPQTTEAANQVVSTEAGTTQQPSIFDTFKEKFGVEIADENQLISHYGEVLERSKSVDTLTAELAAANAKTPEYPTEALGEIAGFQRALIEKGITDKAEIYRKTNEFIEENSLSYSELIEKNPAMVIERGIRVANSHLSPEEINYLVKRENAVMPTPVDEKDFDGDPEGLAEAKAEYADKMTDLRIRAKAILPKLEENRKNLDFQPKGYKTKEEAEKEAAEYKAGIASAAESFKTGFKGIQVGDETIEIPKEKFDEFWNEFSKPDGLADKMYNTIMDPSTPEGFSEFAQLALIKRELGNIIAREREKAESEALKKFKNDLRGGGSDSPGSFGAGDGTEDYKRAMASYTPN